MRSQLSLIQQSGFAKATISFIKPINSYVRTRQSRHVALAAEDDAPSTSGREPANNPPPKLERDTADRSMRRQRRVRRASGISMVQKPIPDPFEGGLQEGNQAFAQLQAIIDQMPEQEREAFMQLQEEQQDEFLLQQLNALPVEARRQLLEAVYDPLNDPEVWERTLLQQAMHVDILSQLEPK